MALKNPVVTIKSSNSFCYLLLALQSILSLKRKSPVTWSWFSSAGTKLQIKIKLNY